MAEVEGALTRWLPRTAVAETLSLWAVCFAATVVSYLAWQPAGKFVATIGFLYLPLLSMDRRGEDYPDFGLSTRRLRADLLQFLAVSAVVFPLFVGGYWLFMTELVPRVPVELLRKVTPYSIGTPHFSFRLPDRFTEWLIDQLFVVALPEEFFYRGFIQTRLRDAWPHGRLFLGVRLGPAFWLTAVLFALGHLAVFEVWRLAVFFPALIFAWMRERSGSIVGAALFHASANMLIKVLDASFFA